MKILKRLTVTLAIIALSYCGVIYYLNSQDVSPIINSQNIVLHFIDVGQADSVLITLPDKKTMLIDAGNNDDGDLVVDYIKKQKITTLDYVVGTHPHEDHIGGLDDVIDNFNIGIFYMPNVSSNTVTCADVLTSAKKKNIHITSAKAGMKILDEDDLDIDFLAPNSDSYEDVNDYSVVAKIVYKNNSFLLEGDAEEPSEIEMLGRDITADLIKIGHHGSSSSSSNKFVRQVSPKYGIISVGKQNTYNHPSNKTLSTLEKNAVSIYRTDISGTIIAQGDGQNITITTER